MSNSSRLLAPLTLALVVLFTGIFLTGWFNLYYRYPGFDKALHIGGGVITAWLVSVVFLEESKNTSRPKYYFLFLSGFALVGVLWEFAEFSAGVLTKDALPVFYYYFHGGNLPDTIGDLAAGLLGATLFALWLSVKQHFTKKPESKN